jgi:hypothetical protein
MRFTAEQLNEMRQMLESGRSAADIGDALGCSRKCVLAHRSKWGIRTQVIRKRPTEMRPGWRSILAGDLSRVSRRKKNQLQGVFSNIQTEVRTPPMTLPFISLQHEGPPPPSGRNYIKFTSMSEAAVGNGCTGVNAVST